MSPTTGKQTVQRTVLDLDTFEDVTLQKEFDFSPVSNVEEAAARLGNDANKLLKVINDGLLAETRREVAKATDGWKVLEDDGTATEDFKGTPANSKIVNGCVLNLAKTVFGFSKDMTPEQKKAAKVQARELVKSTPPILNGLKKSAALDAEEQ